MKLLALDTATSTASVAVLDGDRVLAEVSRATRGRAADVLLAVDEACRAAGVAPGELDAVAVGAGPGSFTGLRIGMATGKGIAFAAGRPLWAVSSLAALADGAPGFAVAVLDARRGEVFAGCYRDGVLVGAERVLAPEALAPWAETLAAGAPIAWIGDALAAYPVPLAPLAERWRAATPSGAAVARRALAGPREDVLAAGAPTYIRAAEAEILYPDGVPGALRTR